MLSDNFIHPVDRHVGARVRELRKACGLSQEALADRLGLTFQQVQKYEKGANRVSASKLYDVAAFLGVEVEAFFSGLPSPSGGRPALSVYAATEEGREVDRLLEAMPPSRRRLVLNLVRELANAHSKPAAALQVAAG